VQLTERDALAAHARAELGIDPAAVANPIEAALASMLSFTLGGLIPLLAMVLAPRSIEIWVSGIAVLLALVGTGAVSAWLGRSPPLPSIVRTVAGGVVAMGVTYGIGKLAGTQL
jgi:VIT1/CCC1 family predicted Fe2+/Mn2+ transporter